jgi:cytochrome P450
MPDQFERLNPTTMTETSIEIGNSALRPAAPVPHTKNLSTLKFILELGKNPIAAFGARAYREHYVYERSRLRHFLMVAHPDGVKHVLLDNAANYVKSSQAQRQLKPALGNGLVTAEGASWRFQRRTAAPMFQMRQIASFAAAMSEATEAMLWRWRALADGAEIEVADELMRLTYDIISRTMFSNDVTMDYRAMSQALSTYFENVGRVDIAGALGLPDWVPTPRRLRAWPALRFFRKEMEGLIARRRAILTNSPGSAPEDLLTLLLTARDPEGGTLFGEAEVFDNVMTFIFAGHETTANALAWTFYLLSEFPEWDARIAAEAQEVLGARVAEGDTVARLVQTRMVLEEAMRLYPPAPLMARDAVGPDTVGGIAIEPGTFVLLPIWVIHRHRGLWADPESFDPERFAPGAREKIHRFAYLPFGAGPRICIGMGFAMQEAAIILSSITREFRLRLKPGHPVEPMARITLRPHHGLAMRLSRRVQ